MTEPCEYAYKCPFADADSCKWQGIECAMYRVFAIEAKLKDTHYITRRVRLPRLEAFE